MNALCAALLSPFAIASSTFLTKVRKRLTRAPLITARRAFRRIRFLAEAWWAIGSTYMFMKPWKGGVIAPGRGGVKPGEPPGIRPAAATIDPVGQSNKLL